jgi:hypothetical protein
MPDAATCTAMISWARVLFAVVRGVVASLIVGWLRGAAVDLVELTGLEAERSHWHLRPGRSRSSRPGSSDWTIAGR